MVSRPTLLVQADAVAHGGDIVPRARAESCGLRAGGPTCRRVHPRSSAVPTRNSERAVIDLRLLIRRSPKFHDRCSPYSAQWLHRENPGRSPNRDSCPPSPRQRPQTLRSQPSQTSTLGPTFLDVAVARLARLALRSSPRETGNSRRLASQRFPILLDPNRECAMSAGTESVIRHGFYNTNSGKRPRYRCRTRAKTFCANTGTPYHRLQHCRVTFDEVATYIGHIDSDSAPAAEIHRTTNDPNRPAMAVMFNRLST